jgi:SAM-dependent methyltransferase
VAGEVSSAAGVSVDGSRAAAILDELAGDERYLPAGLRDWWSAYLPAHREHFLELLSLVEESGGAGRLLDVGTFPGHFTILVKRLGIEVAGVDLDPARAGGLWRAHGIDERQADVETEELPFESGSFGVVVLSEVLEHLRVNPIHALRECHRVTRAGGRLIASVPNVSFQHRVQFLLGRDYQGDVVAAYEALETRGHMGHFRLYTRREVVRMIERAGFRLLRARPAGELPGGRWRFTRYLGPHRNRFRSHLYLIAVR